MNIICRPQSHTRYYTTMLTVKWSSCLKSADWSFNIILLRNTRDCVSLHNIYQITTSDLKTIWQYVVLPSPLTQDAATLTGCESTTCLRSPPRATSCIIAFPRTLLFRRTTNSGLFVQSGQAERWYKRTESFSCSASGWNTRTTPLEFLTSQHWLPLLCIVFCAYLRTTSLCPAPTRWHCCHNDVRRVCLTLSTWQNSEETIFLSFFPHKMIWKGSHYWDDTSR